MAEQSGSRSGAKPNRVIGKRKEPPSGQSSSNAQKRPRFDHRAKQREARSLSVQTSSKALRHGELDVDKFVKAREYEIRALEESMSQSKRALNTRAFQQVPKDLRRRTASHNAKRMPKRLRARARREMVEDNTPTVTARRRKLTRHMRLRIGTANKLRSLAVKQRTTKEPATGGETTEGAQGTRSKDGSTAQVTVLEPRAPRVKNAALAVPAQLKAKFRKRQINKSWLPTHIFHAKRAHMTSPKEPLWRFAVPLTPTAKCYRTTHRSASQRGAIAWDTSYMATIGIEGQQRMYPKVDEKHGDDPDKRKRKAFIRVHPSAFYKTWEEVIRLSKTVKPHVNVEDLRFEIGSIEMVGPNCTEALQNALWPVQARDLSDKSWEHSIPGLWAGLSRLTNLAMLPSNVLLGFDVQDPRLHFPPRKITMPKGEAVDSKLLDMLTTWPADLTQDSPAIFDRRSRLTAASSLSSQKAINRRKATAVPGQYPAILSKDPKIPVLLYTASPSARTQQTWSILLPWKCVQPVWYSILYCPLSVGGQPRFGGLQETRQISFEAKMPWFPGDFPGTQAGWNWEVQERGKRKDEWQRKPKGKRVNWDALDFGDGRNGEIGLGWACDWERLVTGPSCAPTTDAASDAVETPGKDCAKFFHVTCKDVQAYLHSHVEPMDGPENGLATVRLTLSTRGCPQSCARIYRLPCASTQNQLREQWLAQASGTHEHGKQKHTLPRTSSTEPAYVVQRASGKGIIGTTQTR
ncbi:hypothetical protein MRB53_038368 [Persea americana]|nr:hypothetical protein MRB53_038368 [Persea americana]